MYSRISRNVIKIVGGKCRLRSGEWKENRLLILSHKSCRLENQMPSSRYIKSSAAFSHSSLKGFKFISVFVFCLFFFPEDEKLRQYQCATNANQDPVLKPRLHELAMVMWFFHGMSLIQTSFIRDHSHKFHLVSSLFVSLSVAIFCVLTDPPWVASDLEQKVIPNSSPGKDLT